MNEGELGWFDCLVEILGLLLGILAERDGVARGRMVLRVIVRVGGAGEEGKEGVEGEERGEGVEGVEGEERGEGVEGEEGRKALYQRPSNKAAARR